ncbi:UNVERIFIED_CONTAM: hypothetical protein Scaly_1364900 [Sesamum calycinum]|uniref:Uncharacterized protein n=1 Tax=Sesamum calycinum TaxID=2727403 RepID=A0AAW2PKQ2_9LAMI
MYDWFQNSPTLSTVGSITVLSYEHSGVGSFTATTAAAHGDGTASLHRPFGHGSVGPVIGVLCGHNHTGAIAVMIGRLCSGRGIRGHAQYDFESWVETKCASCIDGRVDHHPPPRVVVEHTSVVSSSDRREAAPPPEEEAREHQQQQQEQAETNPRFQ